MRGMKPAAPAVQTLLRLMLSGEVPLLRAWQLGWEPACLGSPLNPPKGATSPDLRPEGIKAHLGVHKLPELLLLPWEDLSCRG